MTFNGGSLLPRRFRLNFTRATVQDRDAETHVAISDEPVWLPTTALTGLTNNFTAAGIEGASEIPFDSVSSQLLTGVDATGITVFEKRIWNLSGTTNLTVSHNNAGSLPANRIINSTGASIVLTPGQVMKRVRAADNANWRGVLCLV